MMYEKQILTNKAIDELVWDEHGQVTKVACIIAPIEYTRHNLAHFVPT